MLPAKQSCEPPSADGCASRPSRRPSRGHDRALWANAAAITLLALVLLVRSGDDTAEEGWGSLMPLAHGQGAPIAGGGGVYLMPAQLAREIWGVYLMDIDSQTMMVYQFDASGKRLNFLAARDFTNDRRLRDYNTFPDPLEVKAIADKEQQTRRLDNDD